MPRILPLDRNAPPASVAPQFAAVKGKLGMVPNLVATPGQSPVALNAYLGLAETVGVGLLSAPDLNAARAGGLNDGEILEVLANVVLNILTNHANHIAETTVDFPAARPLAV